MTSLYVTIFFAMIIVTSLSQNYQTKIPLTYTQGGYQLQFVGSNYTNQPFSLLIDLATSFTILMYTTPGISCLGFSSWDISDEPCGNLDYPQSYPYYQIEFGFCQQPIYLYTDNSDLNQIQIMPTWGDCNLTEIAYLSDFGEGTYGTVGLGYNDDTDEPYILSPNYRTMAVYIHQITLNGFIQLIQSGGPDLSYAKSQAPFLSLPIAVNLPLNQGSELINSIQYGDISILVPHGSQIIWDLNCPGICFSPFIYQEVFSAIQGSNSCEQGATIVCGNIYGSAEYLPNFYITAGGQNITLPPQTYVQNYPSSLQNGPNTLAFNVNGLVDNSSYGFVNATIFGVGVMSYYYTVFNIPNDTMDLYLAINTFPTSSISIQQIDDSSPTPASSMQDNSQSSTQNQTQNSSSNTSGNISQNTTQNPTQNTSEISAQNHQDSSLNTFNNTPQNATQSHTVNTTQNPSQNASSNTSDNTTPQNNSQNTTQDTSQNSLSNPLSGTSKNTTQSPMENTTQNPSQNNSQNTPKDTQPSLTEDIPQEAPKDIPEATQPSPISNTHNSSGSSKVSPAVWIVPVVIVCVLGVCYLVYKRYKKGKIVDPDPLPVNPDPFGRSQNVNRSHLPMPSR